MVIDIRACNISRTYKIKEQRSGGFFRGLRPRSKTIQALKNVSMTVYRGEAVGIVGLNGSGKSTLVKLLTGIIKPDQGTINCLGYDPFRQRSRYVTNIGVSFGQKTLLYSDLPLRWSLELYRVVYGLNRDQFEANLDLLDVFFEVRPFLMQPVRKLSFGQRVRGDLVASLLHSPQLLFLDEPNIGLDILSSESLAKYVRYRRSQGKTTLIVTHDIELIAQSCDRLILLDDGKKLIDQSLSAMKLEVPRVIELIYSQVRAPSKFEAILANALSVEREDHHIKLLVAQNDLDKVIQALTSACQVLRLEIKSPSIKNVIHDFITQTRLG
ncbi:MAG: ATP-binding cassette domain-containing protein [Gammaproteobacteria bacterium]|nr:ATP-binding cassette domain-containing protein [Gammaproteobacteria bacterium]